MRIRFISRCVLSTALLVVVVVIAHFAGTCNAGLTRSPDVASTVEDFLQTFVIEQKIGVKRNPNETEIGVMTLRDDDTSYVKSLTVSALKKGIVDRGYRLPSNDSQPTRGFIIVVLDTKDIQDRVKPSFNAEDFLVVFPILITDRYIPESDVNDFLGQPRERSRDFVKNILVPMNEPEYTAAVQPLINDLNQRFPYCERDNVVFKIESSPGKVQGRLYDAICTGLDIHGYTNWRKNDDVPDQGFSRWFISLFRPSKKVGNTYVSIKLTREGQEILLHLTTSP